MAHELAGVVRSKGYFWLASRAEFAGAWSQAGGVARQELGKVVGKCPQRTLA